MNLKLPQRLTNYKNVNSPLVIYGLFDPRNGELRYVGKTEDSLRVRLNHHVHRALKQSTNVHKANWIKVMAMAGFRPEIEILETCFDVEDLAEAERWHIAYWRSLGCRLTNATAGGEGASGYQHTAETKLRMSSLKRGRSHVGVRHSPESKIKISRSKGGLPFLDEQGRIFVTQHEAAHAKGLTQSEVSAVLRGKRPAARGHTFRYVE